MIVLLLFKPGSLRDGLNALLYTISDVQLVVHANDASAALEFCRENPNILIIMEIKPGDRDLLAQVPEMKVLNPQKRVIALIHNEDDREAAEQAGMDMILDVGTRAPELKAKIEDLVRNLPTIETSDSKRWLGNR
jgi:DNA-binding NarL/FixJ family response regulator